MAKRVIVRHIGGARMHQIDEFLADGLRGILVGRDNTAQVRFDSQRDDMVSREHLRIEPTSPGSTIFTLIDLDSRNGTFLNRQRITRPTTIQHNDVVQVGLQGPEFRFELDPPPTAALKATRVMDIDQGLPSARPMLTREVSALEPSQSRPIGRATVERMLGDTFGKVKKESNKSLWVGIAAILLIAAVGATTFFMIHRSGTEADLKAQQEQQILQKLSQTVRQQPPIDPAVRAQIDQINGQLKKIMAQTSGPKQPGQASVGTAAPIAGNPSGAPGGQSYDDIFTAASNKYKSGDVQGAYKDCVALIGADQQRWEAYYLAGVALTKLQQPDQAVGVFQYALQVAPPSARQDISQKLTEAQAAAQGMQPTATGAQ